MYIFRDDFMFVMDVNSCRICDLIDNTYWGIEFDTYRQKCLFECSAQNVARISMDANNIVFHHGDQDETFAVDSLPDADIMILNHKVDYLHKFATDRIMTLNREVCKLNDKFESTRFIPIVSAIIAFSAVLIAILA